MKPTFALIATALFILVSCKSKDVYAEKSDTSQTLNESSSVKQVPIRKSIQHSNSNDVYIFDVNGDGTTCFPEMMKIYLEYTGNSSNSSKYGEYSVMHWENQHLPMVIESVLKNRDGSKKYRDEPVFVEKITAYINVLDPNDFMIEIKGPFPSRKSLIDVMCSHFFNLPVFRDARHDDLRGWTAYPDTSIGSLYAANFYSSNKYMSEHYMKKYRPAALYEWLPMVDFAMR